MNMTRSPSVPLLAALGALAVPTAALGGIAAKEYLDTSKWDVGDYMQENLVLHYDGIRNVGADLPHSTNTLDWVNLGPNSPAKDLEWSSRGYETLSESRRKNTQGAWGDNGFAFNGAACWIKWNNSGANPVVVPAQYTMQFAMTASAAGQKGDGQTGYLFFPHDSFTWQKGTVALRSTENPGVTSSNALYAVDADRLGGIGVRPHFANANPRYATVMSDASALRVFEGTALPASGDSGYAAITGSSPSRSMNVIALGGLYTKVGNKSGDTTYTTANFQGFSGTLHNFRLYSVPLDAAALEQNRIVDDARFFGVRHPVAVTNAVIASTYTFLDGAEPAGFYTVDGSHAFTAPSGDIAAANGVTYRCAGHTLETWSDASESWSDPVLHDGELSCTVASSDRKRVTWLWKPVSGVRTATGYSFADYSQAGLVLHYDGIFNNGLGAAHSTTATKWKNLATGWEDQDMYWVSYRKRDGQDNENVLQADRYNRDHGAWGAESGFVFDGYECFMKWNEGRKFVLPPAYTWQFAMEAETAALADNNGETAYLFMPHSSLTWERGSLAIRQTANGSTTPANAVYAVDTDRFGGTGTRPYFTNPSPRTATFLADSNALRAFEGAEIPSAAPGYRTGGLSVSRTNNWFAIGGQYQPQTGDNTIKYFQSFRGTLHAIRFYDRPLTQEEVERNLNADSARFFGALAVTNVVVDVESDSGIASTETDGEAYFVEGEHTFTATAASAAVLGYRLSVPDGNGGWRLHQHFTLGDSYTYEDGTSPALVKLEWRVQKPLVLIVQ